MPFARCAAEIPTQQSASETRSLKRTHFFSLSVPSFGAYHDNLAFSSKKNVAPVGKKILNID
jgi:hypothetical protein